MYRRVTVYTTETQGEHYIERKYTLCRLSKEYIYTLTSITPAQDGHYLESEGRVQFFCHYHKNGNDNYMGRQCVQFRMKGSIVLLHTLYIT